MNSPQVIVNVQGGGGSPQDYQALAAKIGKEIGTHARALFTQELRRQMRPGGCCKDAERWKRPQAFKPVTLPARGSP